MLEIRVGMHSHGQGMETTLAQIAHEVLGIESGASAVVHGDTALTPYSTGTWGSRSMVMAGGAVSQACRRWATAHQAHRRRAAAGRARGRALATARSSAARSVTLRRGRRAWYLQPATAAGRRRSGGLEVTAGYRPDATPAPSAMPRTPRWSRWMRDRAGRHAGLRHRRGRRHAGQSDDRRWPGPGRHGARHRHRAVRGDAVRRRGAAARLDARGLSAAGRDRGAGHPHRAHGDAVAAYRSARRASARAVPSGRRRRSSMPSTTRSRGSAPR